MKRALGFRAEPTQIHWAIVEGTSREPILIDHGKASAPVNLDEAPAFTWLSTRVKQIVEQHHPTVAAIRSAESTARGSNKDGPRRRLRIEGVLLQTLDACGLKVTMGALATISGKLGSRAKKYIDADELRGVDISSLSANAKEAVLVAVAVLPKD